MIETINDKNIETSITIGYNDGTYRVKGKTFYPPTSTMFSIDKYESVFVTVTPIQSFNNDFEIHSWTKLGPYVGFPEWFDKKEHLI